MSTKAAVKSSRPTAAVKSEADDATGAATSADAAVAASTLPADAHQVTTADGTAAAAGAEADDEAEAMPGDPEGTGARPMEEGSGVGGAEAVELAEEVHVMDAEVQVRTHSVLTARARKHADMAGALFSVL